MTLPPWVWTQIWRDLRSGSLRWLMLAVALAVAALSSVGLFADRIERGLKRDASQLLGADVVISADQPVDERWLAQASAQGLRTARTAVFPSMARAPQQVGQGAAGPGGETRLVAVKAVTEAYPLRGALTLGALTPSGVEPTGPAPAGGPPPGQVWVDVGVLQALNLAVGDALALGDAQFRIASVIAAEPDRGTNFVSFAPRVMLRWSDLPATGLIQPASRVTWRLLTATAARPGDAQPLPLARAPSLGPASTQTQTPTAAQALDQFTLQARPWVEQQRGMRLETLEDGRPEMRSTIDRAGLFLRLVALLSALMAAVVVAMVSRDFALQRTDDCALLRVLGVSQRDMVRAYTLELGVVALLASALGLLAGAGFHLVLVSLLSELTRVSLPLPGWSPVLLAFGVGGALTLGFGLPPLLQLAQVPALRVLRRDLGRPQAASLLTMVGGVVALVLLLSMVVRDAKLAAIALGGVAASVALLAVLTAGLLWALRGALARHPQWPVTLRHALRALVAQPGATVVQVCALSMGLLAMFLLILIRTDLVASWRQATPPDAPNRFVINILPDQTEAFRTALKEAGVELADWHPMVRARLVAINEKDVQPRSFTDERAQRLIEREFNLSHATAAPAHNEVTAGQFLTTATGEGEISVEEGLARTLRLKLGDTLGFDMAGMPYSARITSLRKVDWASMRVNFFVMAPLQQAPLNWPETFIAAFREPPGSRLDATLVQRFPNLTVIDVSMSIAQVQGVLEQVVRAVEFLFLFTLLTGVLVLLAGLWSSRERRAGEWAILRAMGASRGHLQAVQRLELLVQGSMAGGMAAVAALAIGGALAWKVFEFAWQPPWWAPLGGMAVGAGLVWLAGWWSLRGLLNRPVLLSLRRAE